MPCGFRNDSPNRDPPPRIAQASPSPEPAAIDPPDRDPPPRIAQASPIPEPAAIPLEPVEHKPFSDPLKCGSPSSSNSGELHPVPDPVSEDSDATESDFDDSNPDEIVMVKGPEKKTIPQRKEEHRLHLQKDEKLIAGGLRTRVVHRGDEKEENREEKKKEDREKKTKKDKKGKIKEDRKGKKKKDRHPEGKKKEDGEGIPEEMHASGDKITKQYRQIQPLTVPYYPKEAALYSKLPCCPRTKGVCDRREGDAICLDCNGLEVDANFTWEKLKGSVSRP